jgi:predicted amino acid racemase
MAECRGINQPDGLTDHRISDQRFPELLIDLDRIEANTRAVAALCRQRGIALTAVVKGVSGHPAVARAMARGGCVRIASSRLGQLRRLRNEGPGLPLLLLRVPAPSELDDTARYADISLQSELATLRRLADAVDAVDAVDAHGRRHGVILMLDLGDLREGWFNADELVEAAGFVERQLPALELLGVGTNLGCYGSIRATPRNLGQLVALARRLEDQLGRTLPIISGGATSSLPLLAAGTMPDGITDLRVGEGILTAMDLPSFHETKLDGVEAGAFTLRLEVLEVKEKPSYPLGERCVDAFGETPQYVDHGIRRRALLGAGKRDFGKHDALLPKDGGVRVVGSSSDHLICDVGDCPRTIVPGDILDFGLCYAAMLYATDCPDVRISLLGETAEAGPPIGCWIDASHTIQHRTPI